MDNAVYDVFFRVEDSHWWFRARRRLLAAVLSRLYPRGGLAIADVGCGTGGMLGMLSRFGVVTGVDEAVLAREYCARRGEDRVLSFRDWDRGDDRYDLVTAFDVVEHVEDDVGFLSRLGSRLKPDGRILVTVPAYPFLWSRFDEMNHHKRRYSRTHLVRSLAGAGFRVERVTHFNTLLLPGVVAVRLAQKMRERRSSSPGEQEHEQELARMFTVGPMNGVLETVFASERHWLRIANLPAGSSILALAKKTRP